MSLRHYNFLCCCYIVTALWVPHDVFVLPSRSLLQPLWRKTNSTLRVQYKDIYKYKYKSKYRTHKDTNTKTQTSLGYAAGCNPNYHFRSMLLHFIQCPFPNQIQFGLEKIHPKKASDFPNQFQFGLERKKLILQIDADSEPNSDWFGKF